MCICIARGLGNGPKSNPKFISIVYTPYMLPEGISHIILSAFEG